MELGFYKVVVSVAVEQENGKVKTHKENYIVSNCGDPKRAASVVEEHFASCGDEWFIDSVKVEKISAVYDALED